MGRSIEQTPQSAAQLEQSSGSSQNVSPHTGAHAPQSLAHEPQSSAASQLPSPQTGPQTPQSEAHELQLSSASQLPFPQIETEGVQPDRERLTPGSLALTSLMETTHEGDEKGEISVLSLPLRSAAPRAKWST